MMNVVVGSQDERRHTHLFAGAFVVPVQSARSGSAAHGNEQPVRFSSGFGASSTDSRPYQVVPTLEATRALLAGGRAPHPDAVDTLPRIAEGCSDG
jgi:hypothetical protein